ncbi:hypothetical protein DITRI_Ditri14bG0127300 [Diplodiscus trichospermus]
MKRAASSSLQKVTSQARLVRTALGSFSRTFSSDALLKVKPGKVGMVSGIPEEHLRRRVVTCSLARTATQQGSGKVGNFDSEEAAKSFAKNHGWGYVVKKR